MASPTGRALTDAHRTAQAQISIRVVAAMAGLWPLLDLRNLDATAPRWIASAITTIDVHRSASAVLAAGYLIELRRLELGPDVTFPPVAPPPLDPAAVTTSLFVTGPVAVKSKLAAAMPWNQAAAQALAGSAAAAARHALSGGRDTILDTARADPMATGLVRVTSPGACDFCVEIASYSETNPNLLGDFQCHDHCNCQPEPVYS